MSCSLSLSIIFFIESIDFIEGKFNLVHIFILFDFKLSFISLEKSRSFKRFFQILIAQSGNFLDREDKIVNFSEFIINLFKYSINIIFNSLETMDIKSIELSKEFFSKISSKILFLLLALSSSKIISFLFSFSEIISFFLAISLIIISIILLIRFSSFKIILIILLI